MPIRYHVKNLFRLPNTGWIILATIFAGMFQSFGLALFLPLLKLLNGESTDLAFPFSILVEAFRFLGFSINVPTLLVVTSLLIISGFLFIFIQRSLIMAYALPKFERQTNRELFSAITQSSWQHISKLSTGEITNQLLQEVLRAGRTLTHLAGATSSVVQIFIYSFLAISFHHRFCF